MFVVMLTGCAGFSINKVDYYNEVLAKVGNDNITRFDLINAYNSYGYQTYVTQQGQSETEALLSTMDMLVQRKLTFKYALDNPDKYELSEYEVKKLYRDTLDYLLESLDENKQTARRIYDLDEMEDTETDAETAETFKMSEFKYESRVDVVDGQIKYVDVNLEKEEIDLSMDQKYITNFKSYNQHGIVKALLSQLNKEFYYNENDEDPVVYKQVCDKAIELTCNNLIGYEYYLRKDGQKLSNSQYDLMYRLVERAYENQLESAYITKVNNVYLQNEILSNESILNAFTALYESDYAKYANDLDAYSSEVISTDSDLIYFTPNSNDEFGYFLHVLLPFNNVEDDLKALKEHRGQYTDDEYKAEQMELVKQITCAQRAVNEVRDDDGKLVYEEGVTLEGEVPIAEVLLEYSDKVRDINSFIEFMFKYTTDTATLTADMPYVIGYNTETDEEYSSMVKNFTAEAIRLMKENQRYTEHDEYILTNYGIHLLYYIEPVSNKVDINNLTVEGLDSAVLNYATGETYLDRVFDLVYPAGSDGMFTSNTKYSDYEKLLIDSLYAKYPVTLYETKIKASNKV